MSKLTNEQIKAKLEEVILSNNFLGAFMTTKDPNVICCMVLARHLLDLPSDPIQLLKLGGYINHTLTALEKSLSEANELPEKEVNPYAHTAYIILGAQQRVTKARGNYEFKEELIGHLNVIFKTWDEIEATIPDKLRAKNDKINKDIVKMNFFLR